MGPSVPPFIQEIAAWLEIRERLDVTGSAKLADAREKIDGIIVHLITAIKINDPSNQKEPS